MPRIVPTIDRITCGLTGGQTRRAERGTFPSLTTRESSLFIFLSSNNGMPTAVLSFGLIHHTITASTHRLVVDLTGYSIAAP